jgi:hypothetical protein
MTSKEDWPRKTLEADAGPPLDALSPPVVANEPTTFVTDRPTGSGLKYEFVDSEG